jgi:hypothetical protein
VRVWIALVFAVLIGVTGTAAAATGPPAFLVMDGQTLVLVPSKAHQGQLVRCAAGRHTTDVAIPSIPPRGFASGTDTWSKHGPALSIDRQPNGTTKIRCGTATSSAAGTGSFVRAPHGP